MNGTRGCFSIALVTAVAMTAPAAAWAAEGSLDTSFGSGGTALTPIGTGNDFGAGVAVDSQDRVVVAGRTVGSGQTEFAVARYGTNGALDDGFGFHGIATSVIGPSGDDDGSAVAIDSLGRVVVAGRSLNGAHYQFGVARLTSSGGGDSSFDGGGTEATGIGPGGAFGKALTTDSQDRIVVAGTSFDGVENVFTVARYNVGGGLDTANFGTGGVATTEFGSANADARAVTIDPEGRIIVAGEVTDSATNDDFAVARYLPNGALDTSFGGGHGFVVTPVSAGDDAASAVAVDGQGRIVAAGSATVNGTNEFALVRYRTDGTLDTSFGNGGKVTTPIGASADGSSLVLDPQGRVVVGGGATVGAAHDFALARYRANGTLDPSFGSGGVVTRTVGTGSGVGEADGVAIDSRGRIVAAGTANNGTNLDFAAARFIGDATPPHLAITSGPANGGFTKSRRPSFGFTTDDPTTPTECAFDATAPSSCPSPAVPAANLADGPHKLIISSTDAAGNVATPAERTFTVDTEKPKLTIKGKRRAIAGRHAPFILKTREPVTLRCKLDRRRAKHCSKRYRTPKLRPGKHRLKVTATDRAGNRTVKTKHFRAIQGA